MVGHSSDGVDQFEVDAWIERSDRKDSTKITYDVKFTVEDPYILELIEKGYAAFACEFDCLATQHRGLVWCEKENFTIHIDPLKVSTVIRFLLVVVAIKDIDNYENPNVNAVYRGSKYHIHKGEVLAYCKEYSEAIDKGRNDRMNIMRFRKTTDKYISHDISGDYIVIKLPAKIFEHRKVQGIDALLASLVVPAVNFALENMSDTSNDGKLWAEALRQQILADEELCKFLDGDNKIEDPAYSYLIAQGILSNPHLKFFEPKIDDDEPDND